MNVREGMRRLGILVAVCGGILGACLEYSDAKAIWQNLTAYRQFAAMIASPIMHKVANAARDYAAQEWRDVGQNGYSISGGKIAAEPPHLDRFGGILIEDQSSPKKFTTVPPDFFDTGGIIVSVNLDGIKRVAVDVNNGGRVCAIETSPGAWIYHAEAPRLISYLSIVAYPILGFLLPWVVVRILMWVGSGFFQK